MDTRQNLINLLEKALEAARAGRDLPEVGQLIARASEAAGTPSSIVQLARETRAKGHGIEADIVAVAIDVASTADKGGEAYEHSLVTLHDLVCERLDQIHDEKHHKPRPPQTGAKTVSRLN